MEVSNILNGASLQSGAGSIGSQIAAATRKPVERPSQPAESTRVQLSAAGQLKSAAAEVEDRRANQVQAQAQQGFSFNGVRAYSRIFGF